MTRWLALDTASARACIAVLEFDSDVTRRVLAERGLDVPRRHAESIAGAVDACLAEGDTPFAALDGFAAGVGPGSFVGVRVAIATAKGFALALQRPLVGFCSLAALGGHQAVPDGLCLAVIDARRGEVYARPIRRSRKGVVLEGEVAAMAPNAAVDGESPRFLVGSGAALCAPFAPAAQHVDVQGPDGEGLLAALQVRLDAGFVDEAATLVPNYCRAPDAKKPGER